MVPPFEFTSFLVPNIILFFNMILVTINKLHPWWGGDVKITTLTLPDQSYVSHFPALAEVQI